MKAEVKVSDSTHAVCVSQKNPSDCLLREVYISKLDDGFYSIAFKTTWLNDENPGNTNLRVSRWTLDALFDGIYEILHNQENWVLPPK